MNKDQFSVESNDDNSDEDSTSLDKDSRTSNHGLTAFLLRDRRVLYRQSHTCKMSLLKAKEKFVEAVALEEKWPDQPPDFAAMQDLFSKVYKRGNSFGEAQFDDELFNALNTLLGDHVLVTLTEVESDANMNGKLRLSKKPRKSNNCNKLAVIVLKGSWTPADRKCRTSQSEVWTLSLGQEAREALFDDKAHFDRFMIQIPWLEEEMSVWVKVVSSAIVNPLTQSYHAFQALEKIAKQKPGIIKQVFVGAILHPTVCLSISRKDIKDEYTDLNPACDSGPTTQLWSLFVPFAVNYLFELALLDIIHPDIRCGYNWVANVMVNSKDMVLVDLDSLLLIENYKSGEDKRYIMAGDWSAREFVCFQCISIAHCWKYEIAQDDFDFSKCSIERTANGALTSDCETNSGFSKLLKRLGDWLEASETAEMSLGTESSQP